MKNLFVLPILALALLVGTQTINAQEVSYDDATVEATQEKYIDLAIENLPQTILDAVAKDHAGATIESAGALEDATEFKLVLMKDGETVEVFADAEGTWIPKT